MIDPSRVFRTSNDRSSQPEPDPISSKENETPTSVADDDCHSNDNEELFSPEQEKLFAKHYEEGYNFADPIYIAWLKLNHADKCMSVSSDTALSDSTSASISISKSMSSTSSGILSDILALPSAPPKQKRNAMNSKAVCVTDMLDDLKLQEAKKMEAKDLVEEK